ncbi:MAG: hypothetical protein JEY91_14680 [Spirochaetaceae bacterium]|nr:hypothetical protein [Spirochaetaceae bacterium]
MNRDRKILLIILFFTVISSLSFLNIFILKERRSHTLNRLTVVEKNYEKLGGTIRRVPEDEIRFLKEQIEVEKGRFFSEEEMDPYKFGLEIKGLLENRSMTIISYKTIELEDIYLIEFTVTGSSTGFFRFLKTLYDRQLYYHFPYFSIKNEKYGISSTFRIGYSLYE